MHKLSRLTPFSLFRRWLDVRAAEAVRQIAVKAISDVSFARGREYERQLLGAR